MKLLTVLGLLLLFLVSCDKDNDNMAPTANAGPSKTTILPNSVTVTGTGTDADGSIVSFLWSQVSGPTFSTIVNPGNATTDIKFTKDGSYLFQLMVTDNSGATGVDTMWVTVNPQPEQTLTLQPVNNPNEIAVFVTNGTNTTHTGPDIPIEAWTVGGNPAYGRSLMKFDLSTIPQNAIIVSANLYLYSYPPPTLNGNFIDANFGTNNSMTLQRVTSGWSPSTVTWANQPATTTNDQVDIPHTPLSSLDLNLNVTNIVSNMISNNTNYGFFIKLVSESIYTSRIFVSSFNTTYPDKRPKLVVVYK